MGSRGGQRGREEADQGTVLGLGFGFGGRVLSGLGRGLGSQGRCTPAPRMNRKPHPRGRKEEMAGHS